MRITEEEARLAGGLMDNMSWTDEELALVIKVNKLVIAYLEERGATWRLDMSYLRKELYEFEGFVLARQRKV